MRKTSKQPHGQARTYKGSFYVLKYYQDNSVLCRIDGR